MCEATLPAWLRAFVDKAIYLVAQQYSDWPNHEYPRAADEALSLVPQQYTDDAAVYLLQVLIDEVERLRTDAEKRKAGRKAVSVNIFVLRAVLKICLEEGLDDNWATVNHEVVARMWEIVKEA